MSAKHDLKIEAGATFIISFTYLALADPPTPFPLDGYTAHFQARGRSGAVLDKDLPIDVPTSTIELKLTAAETALLTLPRYAYGIELTAENGEPVIRMVDGVIETVPEVVV